MGREDNSGRGKEQARPAEGPEAAALRAAPCSPHHRSATAVALHSHALLCSLPVGESPHPYHLPGVLGISADLQLILRAGRLRSWTHYHFNWSASVLPWGLLEKQTKVCK